MNALKTEAMMTTQVCNHNAELIYPMCKMPNFTMHVIYLETGSTTQAGDMSDHMYLKEFK